MITLDNIIKENIKEHDPNWPEILDHPYRILIIGDSGSGNIDSLFNLISQQQDIDKIYLDMFIKNRHPCCKYKNYKKYFIGINY